MSIKCECGVMHDACDDENPMFSENMLKDLDLSTFEPKSRTKLRHEIAKFLISKNLVKFDLPINYQEEV